MKATYSARRWPRHSNALGALCRILAQHLGLPVKVIWSPLGGASIYADYVLMHPRFLLEILRRSDSVHQYPIQISAEIS